MKPHCFSSAFHLQQITCDKLLSSESWSSCSQRINPQHYIQACALDMCSCSSNSSDMCVCSTLSEFSRQCSHAGGQPPNWRNPNLCGNVSCFCGILIRICKSVHCVHCWVSIVPKDQSQSHKAPLNIIHISSGCHAKNICVFTLN